MKHNWTHHWLWLVMVCVLGVGILPIQAQDVPVYEPPPTTAWDGRSRLNILVLGVDRRPGARDTLSTRTDVVLLVSIDPTTRSIGVVHIPRDVFLVLPDVGELARINTVMVLGERKAEGYGPYYLMNTIGANFGMNIHNYIAVDFEAFINLIDAIGGVTIDVPYTISDPEYPDMNYGYDPLYLARGVQVMDGRTALKFARTRHDDDDFMRGLRQMQVVTAVRDKLSDPAVLQNLLYQVPQLAIQMSGHVYSNIPNDQLVFVGLVVLEMDAQIVTGALNRSNTLERTVIDRYARIPNIDLLDDLLIATFGADYWR